jgi:glutamyl-tRNA reductase
VELARRYLGRLEGKSVLLVGAGRNAELAARILLRAGAGRLVVANRTVERARRLAEDLMRPPKGKEIPPDETNDATCPALLRQATPEAAGSKDTGGGAGEPLRPEAVGLEEIPRLISSMDLVLASTASPQIVLDYETLAEPIAATKRPLVILDIAMPRDADPRLGRLPNVRLCNLDDMERLVEENLDRRRAEIPRAETIVAEEVRAFDNWAGSLQVAPTIRLLQKRLEQIQKDLVGQHGSRFSDADRPQLEHFTQSLCGRLLHDPLTFLRGLSEEAPLSETLATVEIIRRMFDLDALEQDE